MKRIRNLELFLINILVPQVFGLTSVLFAGDITEKYMELTKPSFAPPAAVFSIVWTILFILIGISSYLICVSDARDKKQAKFYYSAQLGAVFLWPILFFGIGVRFFSFLWILLLLYLAVKYILEAKKINKTAAVLFYPYILWLIYAAVLNFSVWMLNK